MHRSIRPHEPTIVLVTAGHVNAAHMGPYFEWHHTGEGSIVAPTLHACDMQRHPQTPQNDGAISRLGVVGAGWVDHLHSQWAVLG